MWFWGGRWREEGKRARLGFDGMGCVSGRVLKMGEM